MRTLIWLVIALALVPSAAHAHDAHIGPAPVTFSLSVPASVTYGSTFWVSYGPLGGKFGVVELHRKSATAFKATAHLPAGTSTFYYLVGHGAVRTPGGLEPGGAVIKVRSVRLTIGPRALSVHASYQPNISSSV